MTQPDTTLQNLESGQEVAKGKSALTQSRERHISRFHKEYWKGRLERRCYTQNGSLVEVNEYSVRIQHLGRRRSFALGSTNAEAAAIKARDIYAAIANKGWDAGIAEFDPGMLVFKDAPTIGEFLHEVESKAGIKPKTFRYYASCLRMISAQIFDMPSDRNRFDYRSGGHKTWSERVDAMRLQAITPDKVQAWKVKYLKDHSSDPARSASAKRSVNTFIGNARSLFSRKALKFVRNLRLPDPLPFHGIEKEKSGSTRYRSQIDAAALVKAAKAELAKSDPEQYKVFLLALGAGLRRAEIDCLQISQIDWANSRIRVETTEHFSTKSQESEGIIDVDPILLTELRRYRSPGKDGFVIRSDHAARPNARYQFYRCQQTFQALLAWLRAKGVNGKKPLHTLRKEFGSLICEQAGIYAAMGALRHAQISTTAAHYIDKRSRVILNLGQMFRSKPKNH